MYREVVQESVSWLKRMWLKRYIIYMREWVCMYRERLVIESAYEDRFKKVWVVYRDGWQNVYGYSFGRESVLR